MIKDRVSRAASALPSTGDPSDVRSCGVDDRTDLAWGDAVRRGSSAVAFDSGGVGDDEAILGSTLSVSKGEDESRRW